MVKPVVPVLGCWVLAHHDYTQPYNNSTYMEIQMKYEMIFAHSVNKCWQHFWMYHSYDPKRLLTSDPKPGSRSLSSSVLGDWDTTVVWVFDPGSIRFLMGSIILVKFIGLVKRQTSFKGWVCGTSILTIPKGWFSRVKQLSLVDFMHQTPTQWMNCVYIRILMLQYNDK